MTFRSVMLILFSSQMISKPQQTGKINISSTQECPDHKMEPRKSTAPYLFYISQHLHPSGKKRVTSSERSHFLASITPQNELTRDGRYSFIKLTLQYKTQALQRLSLEFADQQPISNAYCRKFPAFASKKVEIWRDFWKDWIQDSCTNNISVAAIDLDTNQMIGVLIAKDLHYEPKEINENYVLKMTFMTPILEVEKKLFKLLSPHWLKQVAKPHNIMDLLGVAIDEKHMGKGLLERMTQLVEQLAVRQKFKYSVAYCTNIKSQKGLRKIGYDVVARTDPSEIIIQGIDVLSELEKEQRFASLWIKPLSEK